MSQAITSHHFWVGLLADMRKLMDIFMVFMIYGLMKIINKEIFNMNDGFPHMHFFFRWALNSVNGFQIVCDFFVSWVLNSCVC